MFTMTQICNVVSIIVEPIHCVLGQQVVQICILHIEKVRYALWKIVLKLQYIYHKQRKILKISLKVQTQTRNSTHSKIVIHFHKYLLILYGSLICCYNSSILYISLANKLYCHAQTHGRCE